MSYPSRPADLPPTVNCPYCLSHIDTSRARSVIRNIATQEVVDDVTDAVRRRGLLGVASYDRGNTYLECRREVRLDLVQGEYDYPGTADPLDDMTTVVMNRPGEDSPTAAFTDGIGFDDPEEDESAGPSPFSLADDATRTGTGGRAPPGPSPALPSRRRQTRTNCPNRTTSPTSTARSGAPSTSDSSEPAVQASRTCWRRCSTGCRKRRNGSRSSV